MMSVRVYIEKIKALVSEGDAASLTYAALEVRLAVEHICYQRLRLSHAYISAADLSKWQPGYVVQTVMELVDSQTASGWSLSISREPAKNCDDPRNTEEWVHVGTQVALDVKLLVKIWQTMGSFLHAKIPKSHDHPLMHYPPVEKMLLKIEEALEELERIAEGTIVGSIVPEVVSFTCECGQVNKRSMRPLKHNDVVNCILQECPEQFKVERDREEISFSWMHHRVPCEHCKHEHKFPYRPFIEMAKDAVARFECRECKGVNHVKWMLRQVRPASTPVAGIINRSA